MRQIREAKSEALRLGRGYEADYAVGFGMVIRNPKGARKLFWNAGRAQDKIQEQRAVAGSLKKDAEKNRPVLAARRRLLRMRARRALKSAADFFRRGR